MKDKDNPDYPNEDLFYDTITGNIPNKWSSHHCYHFSIVQNALYEISCSRHITQKKICFK